MDTTISTISINGKQLSQDSTLDLANHISILGEVDIIRAIITDPSDFSDISASLANPSIEGRIVVNVDISGDIKSFLIIAGSISKIITIEGYIPVTSIFGDPKVVITLLGSIDTKSEEVILGYWLLDFSDSINSFYITVI